MGSKSGYSFAYTGGEESWSCEANPHEVEGVEFRHFFVDQSGVIRFSSLGSASSVDEPIR